VTCNDWTWAGARLSRRWHLNFAEPSRQGGKGTQQVVPLWAHLTIQQRPPVTGRCERDALCSANARPVQRQSQGLRGISSDRCLQRSPHKTPISRWLQSPSPNSQLELLREVSLFFFSKIFSNLSPVPGVPGQLRTEPRSHGVVEIHGSGDIVGGGGVQAAPRPPVRPVARAVAYRRWLQVAPPSGCPLQTGTQPLHPAGPSAELSWTSTWCSGLSCPQNVVRTTSLRY
jgi:hypothetical protein